MKRTMFCVLTIFFNHLNGELLGYISYLRFSISAALKKKQYTLNQTCGPSVQVMQTDLDL